MTRYGSPILYEKRRFKGARYDVGTNEKPDLGYEKMISKFVGILFREVTIKRLRENSAKCRTIDDHIDLAFSFGFRFSPFTFRPSQIKWVVLRGQAIGTY